MKKLLIVFMCLLTLTGCSEDKKENDNTTTTTTARVVESVTTTTKDVTTAKTTTKKTTTTTTKKKSTTTTTTTSKTTTTCASKKFANKYSYVYTSRDECLSKGNRDFLEVADNVNSKVFTYECEQIIDGCGDTYYGVFFNVWNGQEVERYYY